MPPAKSLRDQPRLDLTLRVCDREGGVEIVGEAERGRAQLEPEHLREGDALQLALPGGDVVRGRIAALPAAQTEPYPGLCFRLVGVELTQAPEPAPERDRGVHGNLLDLSLPDVVQAMEMCRKTVEVCVQPDIGLPGSVYLRQGEVVCAQAGAITGEEAFYVLAAATQGRFSIRFGQEAPERNVHAKVTHLLLEAARRQDEQARDPFDERTTEEPRSGDSSCVFDLIADDADLGELPGDVVENGLSAEHASGERTPPTPAGRGVFGAFFDANDSTTEVEEPTVRMAMLH